ncbi:zinc-dependent metalloprotease [Leucobacter triazinivorans]|uniref:Zinc-dependent metalloprotease n=1 Tax=Leucobacter triazinivorans TaxID=1784719 RepID=A0A4P6KCM8_9MICO|nr:zinc-dependent metalloprotease [Leucobacter triazinivorans]QBE47760.1 zinc-dependent metalloprotease [Leucobacter triazinivorans]
MSANDQNGADDQGRGDGFEELQRLLREMLSGGAAGTGMDPAQFAKAAGLPMDPQALQGLFSTLQGAMQHPGDGIDWSAARRTAIEVASDGATPADPAPAERAFPVAALWLDEATELGTTPDAPRTLTRIEWVQQSIDTWVGLAEPVAESITRALMEALESQMPEELSGALHGASPMLRSVGGALFAVQLGTIVGRLSGEVVSAGDIGIPLLSGTGREGGALLPAGVAAFADGLDQDAEAVTLYLAVRELAHARLFRHSKWLRLHLLSAITEYARGIRIDTDRIEELAREIDPEHPEQIQELIAGGALIPPRTEAQETAHARLETMLALVEGWVDVVTADAAKRLPGAEAIAEMVRRRRATGGPAEHAFSALVGLELRPRRLREAAALWRLVAERSDVATRDGLWAHPDLLPSSEELDHPARLLERLGLAGAAPDAAADDFDTALAQLLDGELPPHQGGEDGTGRTGS